MSRRAILKTTRDRSADRVCDRTTIRQDVVVVVRASPRQSCFFTWPSFLRVSGRLTYHESRARETISVRARVHNGIVRSPVQRHSRTYTVAWARVPGGWCRVSRANPWHVAWSRSCCRRRRRRRVDIVPRARPCRRFKTNSTFVRDECYYYYDIYNIVYTFFLA